MLTDNNSNKPNVDQHYPKSKKKGCSYSLKRKREKEKNKGRETL